MQRAKANSRVCKKSQISALAFFACACLLPVASSAEDVTKKAPEETERVIISGDQLSGAAESLSSILEEARKSGLIQSKGESEVIEQTDLPPAVKINTRANCTPASVLEFEALKPIAQYDDLSVGKEVSAEFMGIKAALHLSRVQLSLGLGLEASVALSDYNTPEAELLKRAGEIVSRPHRAAATPILAAYRECGPEALLWSVLENPTSLQTDISGEQRRVIIETLDNYPPHLKELLSINLATRAAENDQNLLARAIWKRLDDEARENGTTLPDNKTDRHDYLYLSGLLNADSDPTYFRGVLNYLAEREGLYRVMALKKLSSLNREAGTRNNKNIEADLLEVSASFSTSDESQSAAMELVKNQIHLGHAMDAIDVTKRYFEETDAEFRQSAMEIASLVQGRLQSEHNLNRLMGLNDYLYDPSFYEFTGDTEPLKYEALLAAISSGLPELHKDIFKTSAGYTPETSVLLKQAEFLSNLKFEDMSGVETYLQTASLSDDIIRRVAEYALAEDNITLAKIATSRLMDIEAKRDVYSSIAWVEGRWDESQPAATAENESEQNVVKLLTTETIAPIKMVGRDWVNQLPNQLSKLEDTIQQTQDYLNNG